MRTAVKTAFIGATILLILPAAACVAPWDYGLPFNWPNFLSFPFGILGLALYFLPTILAAVRHCRQLVAIILLTVLAGWTFVGWIIALVWSLVGKK